jgi:hypothetical protein
LKPERSQERNLAVPPNYEEIMSLIYRIWSLPSLIWDSISPGKRSNKRIRAFKEQYRNLCSEDRDKLYQALNIKTISGFWRNQTIVEIAIAASEVEEEENE